MKHPVSLFASAARTATPTPATFNTECRAGFFFINVTAVTATPSVVFTISGVDPASGAIYTILASVAIVGTGLTVLRVGENMTAANNTIAKDMLPQAMVVAPVHGDADSITYTVYFVGVN